MGVQGLWELLSPVGRRVSVDALGSRKLAIDASIWIVQFMKAMRDDKGDMIRNAHLLGFFRRICKLLFLRIKPVFIFDGATPALKRRTVLARRRQREKAQSKIRKTAEKLLLNHLRTRKLEEIATELRSDPPNTTKAKIIEEVQSTSALDGNNKGQNKSDAPVNLSGPSTSNDKSDHNATDALLAASLAADYGDTLESGRKSGVGSKDVSDDDDDDDDSDEQLVLPVGKGLDPSVLASLPPSMQLDLLVQMREQLVAENRQKFHKVAKVPSSFSQMQIQAYLKTVAFRREINEVQKAAAGGGIGGVPTARVASTTDREFIFSKSFQGEKPVPTEIEEQRKSEQATPPKPVPSRLPQSLLKPSVLCRSTKNAQEANAPEESVVSLVSTELAEQTESNTNSVVHTYIDERGHVRVNRRRGMGVRMTRDLQWNLYLMKDVEARKSVQSSSGASDPPIIPLKNAENEDFQMGNIPHSHSMVEQGLQISFVDDGCLKDDDGGLFDELVMHVGDSKDDQASAIQGPSCRGSLDVVQGHAGVSDVQDVDEEEEWEEGGIYESRDDIAVEDRDLAEAVRLSLEQNPVSQMTDASNEILLEDGPSSGDSEVEWEDGTGDVTIAGFNVATSREEVSRVTSVPSEEAEFEEAIRRSLEDFGPPAKPSSQLVIKEPADIRLNNMIPGSNAIMDPSPLMRDDAESEELYLARERTRKGKAVVGGEERTVPAVLSRPHGPISEKEQIAALTLSEMPVTKAALQTPGRLGDSSIEGLERVTGGIDFSSIYVPTVGGAHTGNSEGNPPIGLQVQRQQNKLVEDVKTPVKAETNGTETVEVPTFPPLTEALEISAGSLDGDDLLGQKDAGKVLSTPPGNPMQASQFAAALSGGVDQQPELHHVVDENLIDKVPSQSGCNSKDNEVDSIRDVEDTIVNEREHLQTREKDLKAKKEQLAREEADLQAELQEAQADILAELDKEREMLAQEEMELRATQKKNERNADSVTGEMFTEVQELLQMFGLPYIIAPMEAEAQCAYMDIIQLVDGVVTDDSDVFLFGGRTVYKNLFDDRKYVETYYMKDLESEMGMTKEKLIRIAMLLGSDYTEGISGIGIVNAIEVVNAFPEGDGLLKFKEWLDSPDHELFQRAQGNSKVKASGKGDGSQVDESFTGDETGDLDEFKGAKFTAPQRIFMGKHRAVSKNWIVPDSFPSDAVVSAYTNPVVDKSAETFTWGRPDLESLRRFCYERFIWNKEKADELLLPVLREYDRRETQTRLESFYHFNQRFAKIRSRRIQKAVTGLTGKRSAELMDLPPHLIKESPKKKTKKRGKLNDDSLVDEDTADVPHQNDFCAAIDPPLKGMGRGRRGHPGRGRKQQQKDACCTDTLAGNVENLNVHDGVSFKGGRGMSRSNGRGRGRGKHKTRAASEEEASISTSDDSEDEMHETLGAVTSLTKGGEETPEPRRSTRQRAQVAYDMDNSDEELGGTCSDGEEMFKEVDLLVAETLTNKAEKAASQAVIIDGAPSNSCGPTKMTTTTFHVETSGPPKNREFPTGGGFFTAEEDVLGQPDMGIGETSYLTTGGGFCLQEDEDDIPTNQNDVVIESSHSPQNHLFKDGVFCSDDVSTEPTGRERQAWEENVDHHEHNSHEAAEEPSSDYGKQSSGNLCVTEIAAKSQMSPKVCENIEPENVGLRAMPFMRRKRQRNS